MQEKMNDFGALQMFLQRVEAENAGRPLPPIPLDRMAVRSCLNESLVSYVRARQGMQVMQNPGFASRTLLSDLVAILSQIGEYPRP
jgi:hypothetical protein